MNSTIRNIAQAVLTLGLLIGLSCVDNAVAQEIDEMRTTVQLAGRTTDQQHVQLRLFPDRRELMRSSIAEGFILERSTGSSGFVEVARIKAFEEAAWRGLAAAETDSLRARNISLAFIFLQSLQQTAGGFISFDDGIGALAEQKSHEEFAFFAFVVSSLRSATIAEALGLAFTDTQVQAGQTYTYRVRPVQLPEDFDYQPSEFTITVGANDPDYQNEVDVYEGDSFLSFSWLDYDWVAGVQVERRAPGESAFTRLTDQPLFSLQPDDRTQSVRSSFADSNLVNYSTYTYRFLGYNLFGELVPFAELSATPRDRTPPEAPFLPVPEQISEREVKVSWSMNDTPASDLLGFVVGRSNTNEGEFKLLHSGYLSKETRSLIDTTFVPGAMNYYVVQAVDTALNISSSFPMAVTLVDSIPPAKPVFRSAVVDSSGRVTLELIPNSESDMMGYRLFKSNDPDHEFTNFYEGFAFNDSLRSELQTVFGDTIDLNSLTPKIYYKAQALDRNYNASTFSEIISVARPDTSPPSVPVIFNVISNTDSIELHYHSSESSDLARQELYRKTALDEPWQYRDTLSVTQSVYVDRNVEQGTVYYYSIRSVDTSNLYSDYAFTFYGRAFDDGTRPAIEQIETMVDDGTVRLRWEYDAGEWDVFYVVYRHDADGMLVQHARTDVPSFTEKIARGSRVVYAIRVHTSDGGQSPLSREVVVVAE